MNYIVTDRVNELATDVKNLPDSSEFEITFISDNEFGKEKLVNWALIVEDDLHTFISIAKYLNESKVIADVVVLDNRTSFFKTISKFKSSPSFISLDFVIGSTAANIYKDTSLVYLKIKELFPYAPLIGYTHFENSGNPNSNVDTKKLIELFNQHNDSVFDKSNINNVSAYNNIVRDKIRIAKISSDNTRLKKENNELMEIASEYPVSSGKDYLIGNSFAMRKIYYDLNIIKRSLIRVLILGEEGSGKELIAKAIYEDSPRGKDSACGYHTFNCAQFGDNSNLAISTLFGHKKGSFTDAKDDKEGLLKIADNGTLFLDEIGTLPKDVQEKLLRFLETGTFTKLGDDRTQIHVDIRLITATNADIDELIKRGDFRSDFKDRICQFKINLPTLNARKSDIPLLVDYFIKEKKILKTLFGNDLIKFTVSKDAIEKIQTLEITGNVRGLLNLVQSAMLFSSQNQNKKNIIDADNIIAAYRNLYPDNAMILVEQENDINNFLGKIEDILQIHFIEKDDVNIEDIAPLFPSTKTGKTGLTREYFSANELRPRKQLVKLYLDKFKDKWPLIRSKKLNLTVQDRSNK